QHSDLVASQQERRLARGCRPHPERARRDEENVGMARDRKIRPNEHASHPVGRNTEPTTGWRRHDTGTPYDCACLDPFAPERYAAAICGSYARLKPDLYANFFE